MPFKEGLECSSRMLRPAFLALLALASTPSVFSFTTASAYGLSAERGSLLAGCCQPARKIAPVTLRMSGKPEDNGDGSGNKYERAHKRALRYLRHSMFFIREIFAMLVDRVPSTKLIQHTDRRTDAEGSRQTQGDSTS